MGKVLVFFF